MIFGMVMGFNSRLSQESVMKPRLHEDHSMKYECFRNIFCFCIKLKFDHIRIKEKNVSS